MKQKVSPAVVIAAVVVVVIFVLYMGKKTLVPERVASPSPQEMQELIKKRAAEGKGYTTSGGQQPGAGRGGYNPGGGSR